MFTLHLTCWRPPSCRKGLDQMSPSSVWHKHVNHLITRPTYFMCLFPKFPNDSKIHWSCLPTRGTDSSIFLRSVVNASTRSEGSREREGERKKEGDVTSKEQWIHSHSAGSPPVRREPSEEPAACKLRSAPPRSLFRPLLCVLFFAPLFCWSSVLSSSFTIIKDCWNHQNGRQQNTRRSGNGLPTHSGEFLLKSLLALSRASRIQWIRL